MKKLMIAAAIVCAAAVSPAAQFDWTADYILDSETNPYAGTAKVFYGAAASIDTYMASVAADIAKGNFGDTSMWATDGLYQKNIDGDGNIGGGSYIEGPAAEEYKWFAVILDNEVEASAKNFFMTTAETFALNDEYPTIVSLGMQYERSMDSGNWTAINSVPEPTSGLLLLLGVAGLALRRRRA